MHSDNFKESAGAWILQVEGGYVDDPKDRGGRTNYGISQRSYPDVDIASLTEAEALEIYRRDYWDKARCGEMPPHVALALFDAAVHSGQKLASQLVQRALRITDDGIIGPQTIKTAQASRSETFVPDYISHRAYYYTRLAIASPPQIRFVRGWMRRLALLQSHIERSLK